MTFAYAPALREKALTAAEQCGTVLRRGVYIGVNGPQFGDPGGDPCVPHARRGCGRHVHRVRGHRGGALRSAVLGIAMITNMAAGVLNKPLSGAEVNEIAEKRGGVFREYVKTLVKTL